MPVTAAQASSVRSSNGSSCGVKRKRCSREACRSRTTSFGFSLPPRRRMNIMGVSSSSLPSSNQERSPSMDSSANVDRIAREATRPSGTRAQWYLAALLSPLYGVWADQMEETLQQADSLDLVEIAMNAEEAMMSSCRQGPAQSPNG